MVLGFQKIWGLSCFGGLLFRGFGFRGLGVYRVYGFPESPIPLN